MCGINGIVSKKIEDKESMVKSMNHRLSHRGPDDEGIWQEEAVALGQKRLSIIDLSAAGHQPMVSACGRYVLVFNGEVYNFRELRHKFDYPWQSHTDSEVILAAWEKMGPECVKQFNGMFAFAIWDREEQNLAIVRDRMGIKPLYWSLNDNGLFFSSEVRALLASGSVSKNLDEDSVVDFLRYQTVQTPKTILKEVQMLLPGTILNYNLKNNQVSFDTFWSSFDKVKTHNPGSYEEVKQKVRNLFFESVERRLVADVPFGAFLSGGIDSSAVVGAMAKVSNNRIDTFNITFSEDEFSEAPYARYIAEMHKTNHHEIHLKPDDFLHLLPDALSAMDHPSGDGPNTWVVSKMTKEAGITMALSGLGGDEVFGGYAIFNRMAALEKRKALWKLPLFLRQMAGRSLTALKPGVASTKVKRLLEMKDYSFEEAFAISRQALMDPQLEGMLNRKELPVHNPVEWLKKQHLQKEGDVLSRVSVAELTTYMQNVLLRDSDQMSMAQALEVRVPFLDHELVEYVLSLPDDIKRPVTPKKLLVDSMPDLLPDYIVNRPKMGFVFPWRDWLKGEMHNYADERIRSIAQRDMFNEKGVLDIWSRFLKGDASVTFSRVWPLVVLEEWVSGLGE
ncbi:asparagine synthase (glutamine-hydrolyzing) [Marinilabilia rubra]|uniref:asparagine synthase (glutamine-hydrolyzing) n=1 Tax=Marinilabilia rubra TaxID=2162893 RepID=A0A2U2B3Y0_9BACT|nr:asparagine synthase (glutamine-hydrolyzing) [Marinilabilia rubra]PWD97775.1 asparagine synthase (glutamine-hydrolyzing) [Marinilabilia rubra]